jgi:hypothetical protein
MYMSRWSRKHVGAAELKYLKVSSGHFFFEEGLLQFIHRIVGSFVRQGERPEMHGDARLGVQVEMRLYGFGRIKV